MDCMNAVCRAGDGLPSNAANFRQRKIAAITPSVRFRPSSIEGVYHVRFMFAIYRWEINFARRHRLEA
jgi:hypothetical protein